MKRNMILRIFMLCLTSCRRRALVAVAVLTPTLHLGWEIQILEFELEEKRNEDERGLKGDTEPTVLSSFSSQISCLCCCLFFSSADLFKNSKCLMGYMTDLQSWVDETGRLHPKQDDVKNAIDLSSSDNPVKKLHQKLTLFKSPQQSAKYLSLARCQLTSVPPIFLIQDGQGRSLAFTLQYLTFYGNTFFGQSSIRGHYSMFFNATGSVEMDIQSRQRHAANLWSVSLAEVRLPNLKELDLRACGIRSLGADIFQSMTNLKALYLGENEVQFIEARAFAGLHNLVHLDLSRNQAVDDHGNPINLASDEYLALKYLKNLVSLDLSHTRLTQWNLGLIEGLGRSVKSLSICETGLHSLMDEIFNNTSLEVLDLSYNSGILNSRQALQGIENTLEIVYAREIGLNTLDIFLNFYKLQILQLSNNEINEVTYAVAETLSSLQILDLNKNRVTSWFGPTYSSMPKLKYLSLKDNNLNVITEEMINDIIDLEFLALSGNFIVCNCHAKDLFKMAAINEKLHNDTFIQVPDNQFHHQGFLFFNRTVDERLPVKYDCDEKCIREMGDTGRFRLVDYLPNIYICLMVPESRTVIISDVVSCRQDSRETDYEQDIARGMRKLLALLSIPCVLLPAALIFVFRKQFRYFFITIRNSAMLSLINKKDVVHDDTIFNYDVFVSYCNEDRGWVLDHLLPRIEADNSISVCLHERDFQVGLSILENIVSCMDRSRSIMLIVSQRFLLSQWCQFEMHLAQHRLLETRREDLTLILLEDIPRRLRPNTLHYLMLTKTYIVWPKEESESERHIFWRRLKKTLISQKNKQTENVSLA